MYVRMYYVHTHMHIIIWCTYVRTYVQLDMCMYVWMYKMCMYVHICINLMSHRPDWSRCAGYVEGGNEKWKMVSEGQSSDYLVDVLLAEIAKVDISEIRKDDNFQAMVGLGCIV